VALARLGVLADDPMLLPWRTVEAWTHGVGQWLDQCRNIEGEDAWITFLREPATHA
jgi:hypothetical protein